VHIETFDDLLRAARGQPRTQRLLFVFAAAVLPDAPTAAQRAAFEAGEGGALEPLMSVDKGPDELTGFDALADEAREFARRAGRDWRLVFAAAMDAGDARATDAALESLVAAVREGRLSGLLPLDRQGRVVALGTG
jgi:hypothetical protein